MKDILQTLNSIWYIKILADRFLSNQPAERPAMAKKVSA